MGDDIHFMRMAIEQAHKARAANEVPVGAVVVKDGVVLGVGRNAPIGTHDPSAHAEIAALRAAAAAQGNYRLDGCDVYVTLEPCAMCAGAMLHSRIRRVVFGATDPKTGAAGSVVDLFDNRSLNHHTLVKGGVLASTCAELLHDFFAEKRTEKARSASPLREDALRTADRRFDGLSGYPWAPHYAGNLPTLAGLRMHYLDEGGANSQRTILCLHGYPAWSFVFRKMLPGLLAAGYRVIAPDLIGFGKSDKPKKIEFHTWARHRDAIRDLVESLGLRNVAVVGQGEGGDLALLLAQAMPDRIACVVPLAAFDAAIISATPRNTPSYASAVVAAQLPHLSEPERLAYQAPFPDAGHCAALMALHPGAKAAWPEIPALGACTAAETKGLAPETNAELVLRLLAHRQP